MEDFAKNYLGHILTTLAIIVSCIAIHLSRKKDVVAAAERIQARHDENANAMTELKSDVKHLDNCMDKLRTQVQSMMRRLEPRKGAERRR